LTPWSPVHPKWKFLDGGDLRIEWTRRSRAGTIWADHVEVPLAEEFEKYRVELAEEVDSEPAIVIETSQPQLVFAADQIAPILANNSSSITAKICQIGSHGLSAPLAFDIPL